MNQFFSNTHTLSSIELLHSLEGERNAARVDVFLQLWNGIRFIH